MNINLDDMALFVVIADTGGFSSAARVLGLPKSTLSRRMSEHERVLGKTLLNRSTRSLSLTDEGAQYYARAKPIVNAALELSQTMITHSSEIGGQIKLTTTAAIGQYLLAPAINVFLDKHPAVQIELQMSDTRNNLIKEGIDLAVRLGHMEDSELISRKISSVQVKVVAAPECLLKFGTPIHPEYLTGVDCLVVAKNMATWSFSEEIKVPVKWRFALGNMLLVKEAALAGQGFAMIPEFIIKQELQQGVLIEVLKDYAMPLVPVSCVTPKQEFRSLALRAFMDFLVKWFSKQI